MFKKIIATASILALGTSAALAHVSLQVKDAHRRFSTYKAILQVPHGSAKASQRRPYAFAIPEGVIAIKPQPKPSWILEKVKGSYGKS